MSCWKLGTCCHGHECSLSVLLEACEVIYIYTILRNGSFCFPYKDLAAKIKSTCPWCFPLSLFPVTNIVKVLRRSPHPAQTPKQMKVRTRILPLALLLLLGNVASFCCGALQVGFYRGKCGIVDVEAVVAGVITARFIRDPSTAAALLRLQFHDCFVHGCDASILLDGSNNEKTAAANLRVRGYDIIDQAKDAVEKACPGVVSCADLIAIAARDAVFLSGGGRYNVETGRRDGFTSLALDVNLPGGSSTLPHAMAAFAARGLNATDLVLLLGAHSVGVAHCSFIRKRLYNFHNTGRTDPTMDPFVARTLKASCPPFSVVDNSVNLDQNPLSPFTLDNSFYWNIMQHRAILQIEHDLGTNPFTRSIVSNLATAIDFSLRFGDAMVKLGSIGVLTGTQGEIRRSCRAINKPPPS